MSGDGAMIRDNKKITTTNTAAAMYVSRIDGSANRSRVRNATAPRSRSCGRTSRTMNSRIIGTAMRKLPPQSQFFGNTPVGRSNAMRVANPSTTAPTKVNGRLRSRPNMAAANALMTSRVSSVALSDPPSNGVMRIPASADSDTPSIQL